jgi:hypothetical protein
MQDQGTADAIPKRRLWYVAVAGLGVVLLALAVSTCRQTPLSETERQLVGEWSDGPSGITRTFSADRTFSTSNAQFAGVWHITDGRLTVEYWQQWRVPRNVSMGSLQIALDEFRRSRKTDTCTWDIEISDSGQHHELSPAVDEQHPDGKWLWTRVAVDASGAADPPE